MKPNLASIRLAFFLMAALLFLIIVSAIIPQKNMAEYAIFDWAEALGEGYVVIEILHLDNIYFSAYFFILLGLLAINLIAGNIKRFRIIYKTEKTLIRARHLGSIIFHISLLIIMAGIILNYLYKFEGVFSLTEGQLVSDTKSDYHLIFKGPLYKDNFNNFSIKLDSINLSYAVNKGHTKAAGISFQSTDNKSKESVIIFGNQPYKWKNIEFHFGPANGYSPELVLTDSAGFDIFRSFVRLKTKTIEGKKEFSDFILIPSQKMKIDIKVLEDSTSADSIKYDITIIRGDNLIFSGIISPGEEKTIGNLLFNVPRLRRWCYINVVKSPYINLIFLGFWSATGGLVIRFIPLMFGRKRKHS